MDLNPGCLIVRFLCSIHSSALHRATYAAVAADWLANIHHATTNLLLLPPPLGLLRSWLSKSQSCPPGRSDPIRRIIKSLRDDIRSEGRDEPVRWPANNARACLRLFVLTRVCPIAHHFSSSLRLFSVVSPTLHRSPRSDPVRMRPRTTPPSGSFGSERDTTPRKGMRERRTGFREIDRLQLLLGRQPEPSDAIPRTPPG